MLAVVAALVVTAGLFFIFSPQGPGTANTPSTSGSHLRSSVPEQGARSFSSQSRPSSVESRSRVSADRLAAASVSSENIDDLRRALGDKSTSPGERIFVCQKLALLGTGEAMQLLFETIVTETDAEVKRQMCDSLDLLTNEDGVIALASVAVSTDDPLLLQAVEDCLSRCSTRDTVTFLADLHGEFRHDPAVVGRLCAMLESIHGPQATPALAGLLQSEFPADLFRAASMALAKSPGRDAARELVNATHRPLSMEQKEILREVISSTIEPDHFPVFRDEAGETRDEFWITAFSAALEKERVP